MDKLNQFEDLLFSGTDELSLIVTLFNFIGAILVSFLVRAFYVRYSYSLTGKVHIGSIIPILTAIVFLVIIVVKSSLALSLGLVGALSIVRFRTPIKEPEELVYLFFIIGIGLANGANQFAISIIATLITIIILHLRKSYNDKKKMSNFTSSSTNILQIQIKNGSKNFDRTINQIKDNVEYIKLKSLSTDDEGIQYNFWFDINKKKFPIFIKQIQKITSKNKNISIQIYSRSGIYE